MVKLKSKISSEEEDSWLEFFKDFPLKPRKKKLHSKQPDSQHIPYSSLNYFKNGGFNDLDRWTSRDINSFFSAASAFSSSTANRLVDRFFQSSNHHDDDQDWFLNYLHGIRADFQCQEPFGRPPETSGEARFLGFEKDDDGKNGKDLSIEDFKKENDNLFPKSSLGNDAKSDSSNKRSTFSRRPLWTSHRDGKKSPEVPTFARSRFRSCGFGSNALNDKLKDKHSNLIHSCKTRPNISLKVRSPTFTHYVEIDTDTNGNSDQTHSETRVEKGSALEAEYSHPTMKDKNDRTNSEESTVMVEGRNYKKSQHKDSLSQDLFDYSTAFSSRHSWNPGNRRLFNDFFMAKKKGLLNRLASFSYPTRAHFAVVDFDKPFMCLESKPIKIQFNTPSDSDRDVTDAEPLSKKNVYKLGSDNKDHPYDPASKVSPPIPSRGKKITDTELRDSLKPSAKDGHQGFALKRRPPVDKHSPFFLKFRSENTVNREELSYYHDSISCASLPNIHDTPIEYNIEPNSNASRRSPSRKFDYSSNSRSPENVCHHLPVDHANLPVGKLGVREILDHDSRTEFQNRLTALLDFGDQESPQYTDKFLPDPNMAQSKPDKSIRWRSKLSELMWLELKAHLAGLSMRQQDKWLCTERETMSDILDIISSFRLNNDFNMRSVGYPVCLGLPGILEGVNKENEAVIDHTFTRVAAILEDLDKFESLFPNCNAITLKYPQYRDAKFCSRVKTLCLWYNINWIIRYKIRALADILYVSLVPGIEWPFVDTTPMPEQMYSPNKIGNDGDSSSSPCQTCFNPELTSRFDSYSSFNFWNTLVNDRSDDRSPPSPTSIYRVYVEKSVRRGTLAKMIFELTQLLHPTFQRIKAALNPRSPFSEQDFDKGEMEDEYVHGLSALNEVTSIESESNLCLQDFLPIMDIKYGCWAKDDSNENVSRYGTCGTEFGAMNLPSFRTPFLFLIRVPLDVVHEWLKLRIEQKPLNPSFLSANQLLRECKEVLKAAILMRHYYETFVKAVYLDNEFPNMELDTFDQDLKSMYVLYLEYLEKLVLLTPENTDHTQITLLEQEWSFIKMINPYVVDQEIDASSKICLLIGKLVSSISVVIKEGSEECLEHFKNSNIKEPRALDDNSSLITSNLNQRNTLNMSTTSTMSTFQDYDISSNYGSSTNINYHYDPKIDDLRQNTGVGRDDTPPQNNFNVDNLVLLDFRTTFSVAKERAGKVMGLFRTVRQDCEHIAGYEPSSLSCLPNPDENEYRYLFQKLCQSGFVSLAFRNAYRGSLASTANNDNNIVNNNEETRRGSDFLLRVASTRNDHQRALSLKESRQLSRIAPLYRANRARERNDIDSRVKSSEINDIAKDTSPHFPPLRKFESSPFPTLSVLNEAPPFKKSPDTIPEEEANSNTSTVTRDSPSLSTEEIGRLPSDLSKSWVFVPKSIAKDSLALSRLLFAESWTRHSSHHKTPSPVKKGVETDLYEFMLLVKTGRNISKSLPARNTGYSPEWAGKTFYVDLLNYGATQPLKKFADLTGDNNDNTCTLFLVSKTASLLNKQRRIVEDMLSLNKAFTLVKAQISPRLSFNRSVETVKANITDLLSGTLKVTGDLLKHLEHFDSEGMPESNSRIRDNYKDTVLSCCFEFGFDCFKDALKTVSPCCPLTLSSLHHYRQEPNTLNFERELDDSMDPAGGEKCSANENGIRESDDFGGKSLYGPVIAIAIIQYARLWAHFTLANYELGHGRKPRWALQGFNFLKAASDIHITCYLRSQRNFESYSELLIRCVKHILGTKIQQSHERDASPPKNSKDSSKKTPFNDDGITDKLGHQEEFYHSLDNFNSSNNDLKSLIQETTYLYPLKKLVKLGDKKKFGKNFSWPHGNSDSQSKINQYQLSRNLSSPPDDKYSSRYNGDSDSGNELKGSFENLNSTLVESQGIESRSSKSPLKTSKIERIQSSVAAIDERRNDLLQSLGIIGVECSSSNECGSPSYIGHIALDRMAYKKVRFRWQRGIKIGQGQSAKVYTAVNMESGELMAMKEIKLHPSNDQRIIKEVIEEIKLFENVNHPNLVRYYGVEVHREELLIFMEYCSAGTLEELARQQQKVTFSSPFNAVIGNSNGLHECTRSGLDEFFIRKYTRELLLAVNHLHDLAIVHRDIKGANAYLTDAFVAQSSNSTSSETTNFPSKNIISPSPSSFSSLKLGDFGSAAKLKSFFTVPGEIKGLVGTPPFMAPEVINRCEGNGRAADIWSLGCVVIQMLTGKPPWHELENIFQIMYKVGSGFKPHIPSFASEELVNFLDHCFEVDSKLRWSAAKLLEHPFPKGGK